MSWNIRRMIESDIDQVYAIESTAHVTPWNKSVLRDCILVGYNCLVLETQIEGEWVIGGYTICRHEDHSCHLLNFCIAKIFQSQGFGRKFLQQILDVLAQYRNINYVTLEVRPSNHIALRLYQSMGFVQVEIKPAYYKDKNGVEDAIVLEKVLIS